MVCSDCILCHAIPTFFDNRVPSALPFQDLIDWNRCAQAHGLSSCGCCPLPCLLLLWL